MLAKALMSILPPLTQHESLDVSKIYSIVGKLHRGLPMITQRQFRAIHHTASKISLIG
jgi:magnesium chelatase family protein